MISCFFLGLGVNQSTLLHPDVSDFEFTVIAVSCLENVEKHNPFMVMEQISQGLLRFWTELTIQCQNT